MAWSSLFCDSRDWKTADVNEGSLLSWDCSDCRLTRSQKLSELRSRAREVWLNNCCPSLPLGDTGLHPKRPSDLNFKHAFCLTVLLGPLGSRCRLIAAPPHCLVGTPKTPGVR